jgi:beta-glucosidase-like glycosyl hydrolase
MNLREKCAQMVVGAYWFNDQEYEGAIELARAGAGGFVFFGGSIDDVATMANSLQRKGDHALFIAADYENGAGQQVPGATEFPSSMAIGASGSIDHAKAKAVATAAEASEMGVNWIFAPVIDLNTNPENPVIGTRSFGSNVEKTVLLGKAYLSGLKEKGVLGCAKHFPGHGSLNVDSHLELPDSSVSKEALMAGEVRPYVELGSDLDAIMTSHVRYRELDAQKPASLSSVITGDLLRKELGFEGLIVTDALMMGAIENEDEAVLSAAEAGADLLLMPKDPMKAIETLEKGVESGRLSEEVVNRACDRILTAKEKLGLVAKQKVKTIGLQSRMNLQDHRDLAQSIAEGTITQVKGDCVVEGDCFYVHVADPRKVKGDVSFFEKHLQTGIGRMVIGVFWSPQAFSGETKIPDHLYERIVASLKQDPDAVVVSFGSPYILRQLPDVKNFVCAYSNCVASQRSAAWAVQGKIPFRGILPVEIDG